MSFSQCEIGIFGWQHKMQITAKKINKLVVSHLEKLLQTTNKLTFF